MTKAMHEESAIKAVAPRAFFAIKPSNVRTCVKLAQKHVLTFDGFTQAAEKSDSDVDSIIKNVRFDKRALENVLKAVLVMDFKLR